jgi:hypothetical protein
MMNDFIFLLALLIFAGRVADQVIVGRSSIPMGGISFLTFKKWDTLVLEYDDKEEEEEAPTVCGLENKAAYNDSNLNASKLDCDSNLTSCIIRLPKTEIQKLIVL